MNYFNITLLKVIQTGKGQLMSNVYTCHISSNFTYWWNFMHCNVICTYCPLSVLWLWLCTVNKQIHFLLMATGNLSSFLRRTCCSPMWNQQCRSTILLQYVMLLSLAFSVFFVSVILCLKTRGKVSYSFVLTVLNMNWGFFCSTRMYCSVRSRKCYGLQRVW